MATTKVGENRHGEVTHDGLKKTRKQENKKTRKQENKKTRKQENKKNHRVPRTVLLSEWLNLLSECHWPPAGRTDYAPQSAFRSFAEFATRKRFGEGIRRFMNSSG